MATAAHGSSAHKRASSSASKRPSAAKTTSSGKTQNAIQLLKADHRAVEKLFSDFQKAKDSDRKKQIADEACLELRVHTQIEEEIFYPACREMLKDEDIIDKAVVEHAAAKDLIEEIEGMQPDEELYDAKVTVLCEQVDHHIEEEEKELFPKVQKTDLDLKMLGEQLAERKKELMAQLGGERGRATH